jgi:ATP-dependent helicase HrpB
MLEPRRIAAVGAADYMARQSGEEVGQSIGYTIRYERKVSAATRIEVVTEGVLTRRLQSDPELRGIGIVIFDEFHERNLHSDLALALCLDAQKGLRPDLKIVIMSATLDSDELATKLGNAPVISSEGRIFPVEVSYVGQDVTPRAIIASAVATTGQALQQNEGDVLVFMPGAYEIDRTVEALRREHPAVDVCPLYGGLSLAEQRRAIEPGGRGRKVVVATNVAETSLTIEGVRTVVDCGFEKRPRFDAARGLTTLETVRISRASAKQRAGRSGRLGPGTSYRLWSEGTQGALLPQAPPEITVADLAPLALDLAHWGITDVDSLVWVDAPPVGHLKAARQLLQRLGALNERLQLTTIGEQMAEIPAHPRLGRLLLQAQQEDCRELAAELVALLSEGLGSGKISDLLESLRRVGANSAPANISRAARYWRQHLKCSNRSANIDEVQVARLLAVAYPDHIARLREGSDLQYLLANGMAAEIASASPLRGSEFLIVVDLHGRSRTEVKISSALRFSRDDLEKTFGATALWQRHVEWDEERQQVVARDVRSHGALILQSRPAKADSDDLRSALLGWIDKKGLDALAWSKDAGQLRDRLRFVSSQLQGQGFPDCSDAALLADLSQWLGPYLNSVRSVAQLKKVDLKQALLSRLDWAQKKQLDELAPERIKVPGGSNVRIDYAGSQPVLAVKLQELFGLADSPRIAGGKVPVLIHLLSPAGRPLQVTADLKSFWENVYPEVKKEMKGRYPKHPWPDDPWSAEPTRRTKRRKN